MRETDIPQDIIDHIKSYKPIEKPMTIQLSILIGLFIYYRNIRTYAQN
jgi:hypothetical protein